MENETSSLKRLYFNWASLPSLDNIIQRNLTKEEYRVQYREAQAGKATLCLTILLLLLVFSVWRSKMWKEKIFYKESLLLRNDIDANLSITDYYWSKMQEPDYSPADPRPRFHLQITESIKSKMAAIKGIINSVDIKMKSSNTHNYRPLVMSSPSDTDE